MSIFQKHINIFKLSHNFFNRREIETQGKHFWNSNFNDNEMQRSLSIQAVETNFSAIA